MIIKVIVFILACSVTSASCAGRAERNLELIDDQIEAMIEVMHAAADQLKIGIHNTVDALHDLKRKLSTLGCRRPTICKRMRRRH